MKYGVGFPLFSKVMFGKKSDFFLEIHDLAQNRLSTSASKLVKL